MPLAITPGTTADVRRGEPTTHVTLTIWNNTMTFLTTRNVFMTTLLLVSSAAYAAGPGGGDDSSDSGGGSGGSNEFEGYTEEMIRRVPVEYLTIQEAIDAANHGDLIFVSPGIHRGSGASVANIQGKALWIKSSADPITDVPAVIDGEGVRRGVMCVSGEGSNTIIEGFWIIDGHHNFSGGGAFCENSNPVFKNCTFKDNSSGALGGGMGNRHSNPTLAGCTFTDNSTQYNGGGMSNFNSNPILTDCSFADNAVVDSNFGAGGAMLNAHSSPVLTNCSFTGNAVLATHAEGSAVANFSSHSPAEGSNPIIIDCTFTDNHCSNESGAIYNNEAYEQVWELEDGPVTHSYPESAAVLSGTTICGNSLAQIEGPWYDNGGNSISDLCANDSASAADVTRDGVVDGRDLAYVLGVWGTNDLDADIDGDGLVGGADLSILLGAWN